ncbi:hypothetical protein ACLMJK_007543 [Lecanora helva]
MLSSLRLGLLGSVFASTALAQGAVGAAEFINGCDLNVWYTLSDSQTFPSSISQVEANDGFYTENFDTVSGRSISISTSPSNFFGGGPVLNMEYTLSGGTLFYDLSTVQGNPFVGNNVLLSTTNPDCPTSDVSPSSQSRSGAGVPACTFWHVGVLKVFKLVELKIYESGSSSQICDFLVGEIGGDRVDIVTERVSAMEGNESIGARAVIAFVAQRYILLRSWQGDLVSSDLGARDREEDVQ